MQNVNEVYLCLGKWILDKCWGALGNEILDHCCGWRVSSSPDLALGCFHWGFLFCWLRRNSVGEYWLCLRRLCRECWFLLGGKEFRSLSCLLLYWRVILGKIKLTVIWSYSRLHSDLLGNLKLTVIWSVSRLHSNLLERMKLNWYLVGTRLHNNLLERTKLNWHLVGSRLQSNLL